MSRPCTKAADYERITARLPRTLMRTLRKRSARLGIPVNTEIIQLISLSLKSEREEAAQLKRPQIS